MVETESKAMHTPGPWTMDGQANYVFAGRDSEMMVCQIRGWGYLTGAGGLALQDDDAEAVQAANGRLLAAAPDMLRALKVALPLVEYVHRRVEQVGVPGAATIAEVIDEIAAVIKRVEG